MDMENGPEDIAAFITRLKLPENYIIALQNYGYNTVDDCEGLDAAKLKEMSITLPGHYRRILNKLPSSAGRKQERTQTMDSLPPPLPNDDESGRVSPGLQYLPLKTENTVQARLEHRQLARNLSLPSPERDEDPYLTSGAFFGGNTFTSTEFQVPPRPLTPPPFQPRHFEEEDEYENQATFLPPPPLEPDLCNFEDMPPPPDSPPLPEEDPYLVSSVPKTEDEEDPYLISDDRPTTNPADDYNFLHEDVRPSKPLPNLTINTSLDGEDDYDHLKGREELSSSLPQSPNTLSTALASILSHSPSEDPIGVWGVEGEYDRLNCVLPQSPRGDIPAKNFGSLLTPPRSISPARTPPIEPEEINGDPTVLQRTTSNETAKNMPLPLPPWKAVFDDKPSFQSLAEGSPKDKHPITNLQDSNETDYWTQGMVEEDKSAAESSYDILSLSRRGYTNYGSRQMLEHTQSIELEDEAEDDKSFEYETVEFPRREAPSSQLEIVGNLPPVPHNTPSHTLDDHSDDPYSNDEIATYEAVGFPTQANHNKTSIATAIYSGLEEMERERTSTMNSQSPKNKKFLAGRRLTGMQAQLQKAKAAVIKRKPKRKAKLETMHSTSHSDDESEGSLSSRKSSVNKSLEDLSNVSDLPPYHPDHHQRQSNESYPTGSPTNLRGSRLTRNSPVSRRKRVDAQSSSGSPDTARPRGSIDDGIYEDLDLADPARITRIAPTTQDRMLKPRENMPRPKPPRQRPVSVFMDTTKSSQDGMLSGADERSRTYSATLKRGIPSNMSLYSDEPDNYMDVGEFLKSYSSQVQVIPVSPLTKKRTKSGFLWKHGGHEGRAPLRKRWAVFDGDELAYYESDHKTDFSKGILPVEVMLRLQVPPTSQTIFHLQMKGGRTFIFQAENSDDRTMWTSTIMAAMLTFQQKGGHQHKPGGNMSMPYKEGALKMEGVRQKIYMAIKGDQAVYYKTKNEFIFAQPIARLHMKLASVKDMGKNKFQVVFPYRTLTFTAESEEEKKSWIDPLQEAIAEGLSDYEVLQEIWANESNKKCADCGRAFPDWASINLAIVICKHCAGVHRELGVHNSKVRSLKMDIRIWDSKMKRLLLDIGNGEANRFWVCNMNTSEGITDMADKNQRAWFIKSKYIDMDYVADRREGEHQARLNQSLIDAVRTDNLIEAYHLTFSGADINCYTGKEHAKTPHLLAEYLTYTTLAELLRQNGGTDVTSPDGHITDRNTSVRKKHSIPKTRTRPPVCLKDCLYKYGGDFKNASEDTKTKGRFNVIISALQPGDFQKRLCVLENNTLKYCDPEKPSIVKDSLSCSDLISITVHAPEQAVKAGYQHCFEVSRTSGRTYLFCAEKEDTRMRWTRGLMQEIVPSYIQDAMQTEEEYERIGKIKIKAKLWSKSDTQWATTWCRLCKKKLQYYHSESRTLETIDLRKLVQISVDQTRETSSNQSNGIQSKDAIPIIMLVFRDKSYYIHSDTRPDTEAWMAAIRRADNESGARLEEKQLTTEGVPIVLEKCITYVEQFGIATRGIYRLSGTHSKTTQLLCDFQQNARESQMREGHMNVHDVANALKRWFKSLPGSLLTEPLHEQWIETSQIRPEHHKRKLEWYKHLIDKIPDINKVTLKVLLNHLRNVSNHEKENEMSIHNLAIVFGPTLMEPQDEDGQSDKYLGQTSQEIACIEDLLQYYDWLFDVTDTDREKEQRMQLAKEKINQAKQQQNMLTTMDYDMMVPIYINRREERCVNYKVNLSAGELIAKVCKAHGYPSEKWALFEVVMGGDIERPLHFSEHVLSVIKSWEMPSTNYILAKNDFIRDKMRWFKQSVPNDSETIMEGQLRFYEGKKKWSKVSGCVARNLEEGTVFFKYFKTPSKPAVSMNISTFNIYLGVDKKTKPPGNGKQGFTVHQIGETPKYFTAETEGELFRWISHILLCMHPEGYTPPVTQENSPTKSLEESGQRRYSDAKYSPYGTISQQELGAQVAARVVNLQRTSSNESTGSARERFLDQGTGQYAASPHGGNTPSPIILEEAPLENSSAMSLEDVYDMAARPRQSSTGSADYMSRPTMLSSEPLTRRPMMHHPLSPVDPRNPQRAGIGIQLQDELSNVLRRKRAQDLPTDDA